MGNSPSKEQLLEYAIKMRERGDRYTSIINYLNRSTDDEALKTSIIKELDELERSQNLNLPAEPKLTYFTINRIVGLIIMIAGGILMSYLWDLGFISTIPFIIIGVGFLVFTGG